MWFCLSVILGIGFIVLILEFLSKFGIHYLASKMTLDLYGDVYSTIIHQPLQFFSSKGNSTGNLTGLLAQEIRSINASTVDMYLLLLQSLIGVTTGFTISLVYSWRIGLLACALLTIFILLIHLQAKLNKDDLPKNTGINETTRYDNL